MFLSVTCFEGNVNTYFVFIFKESKLVRFCQQRLKQNILTNCLFCARISVYLVRIENGQYDEEYAGMTTRELKKRYIREKKIGSNEYPLNKVIQYEDETGKSLFSMDEDDILSFFFDYVKINTTGTLDTYRTVLSKFMNWCMDHHYVALTENIFEGNVQLDPDTLAAYMSVKSEFYYYDEEYIESVCRHLKTEKEYTETVIRCFYEGIDSYETLVCLKKNMVDLENNCICLGENSLQISSRLTYLLGKMMDYDENERHQGDSGRNLYFTRYLPEDVFVFRGKEDTPVNRKQFVRRRIETAAKELAIKGFTQKKIYQSGILGTIYKACSGDVDQVIHLLYEDKKKKNNEPLDRILQEKGYKIPAYRVRYLFKSYILNVISSR